SHILGSAYPARGPLLALGTLACGPHDLDTRLPLLEQLRQHFGRILQIRGQGRHAFALALEKPAREGAMRSEVSREPYAAYARVPSCHIRHDRERRVLRVIVHHDPLPVHAEGLHRPTQPVIEDREVVRLVERRGDDGDQWHASRRRSSVETLRDTGSL